MDSLLSTDAASPRTGRLSFLAGLAWIALGLFAGCSFWNKPVNKPSKPHPFQTQPIRFKPGTVRFELGIAQLDGDQLGMLEQAWQEFDEQAVAVEARQWWDRNGLRVAVVSSQLPEKLTQLVAPREINEDYLDEFQLQLFRTGLMDSIPRLAIRKEIGIHPTEPKWIACSNPLATASWRWQTSSGSQEAQGDAAQAGFMVSSQARGDGSVTVKLVPRIASGAPRPSLGLDQWHLGLQYQQDELMLWDLAVEVHLLPGQTLIATSNYPDSDNFEDRVPAEGTLELGQIFFETRDNQSANYLKPGPRLFLLRLMGSIQDDLFQTSLDK